MRWHFSGKSPLSVFSCWIPLVAPRVYSADIASGETSRLKATDAPAAEHVASSHLQTRGKVEIDTRPLKAHQASPGTKTLGLAKTEAILSPKMVHSDGHRDGFFQRTSIYFANQRLTTTHLGFPLALDQGVLYNPELQKAPALPVCAARRPEKLPCQLDQELTWTVQCGA